MDIREKVEKIIPRWFRGVLSKDHDVVVNEILALITPKDIEWVGECDCCEGRGRHAEGNSGSYPCTYMNCSVGAHREYNTSDDVPKELLGLKCNGTGNITRPATFEEVMEKLPEMIGTLNDVALIIQTNSSITVNNGQLRLTRLSPSDTYGKGGSQ